MLDIKTLIISHRGHSSLVNLGNTLEAFSKTIELKIPMIELDVRRTKDDILVCFHDEYLRGIPLHKGTYIKLNTIANSQGFTIPKLEEVLQLCQGKIHLDIELKESGYEREVFQLVKRYLPFEQYLFTSFHEQVISVLKKIDQRVTTGLLLGHGNHPVLFDIFPEFRLISTQCDVVLPHFSLIQWGFCQRMRSLGKKIYVWTVNEPKIIDQLMQQGVDGIITDQPDKMFP